MAIKLGKNPKTYKKEIPLINTEGATDILVITYKYRSRLEFGTLLDERAAAQKMREASAPEVDIKADPSAHDAISSAMKQAAELVLEIAEGWDVEDPFTLENLMQLECDFPGALADIQDTYQIATLEVRRKN